MGLPAPAVCSAPSEQNVNQRSPSTAQAERRPQEPARTPIAKVMFKHRSGHLYVASAAGLWRSIRSFSRFLRFRRRVPPLQGSSRCGRKVGQGSLSPICRAAIKTGRPASPSQLVVLRGDWRTTIRRSSSRTRAASTGEDECRRRRSAGRSPGRRRAAPGVPPDHQRQAADVVTFRQLTC